jgi:hypothetical protein
MFCYLRVLLKLNLFPRVSVRFHCALIYYVYRVVQRYRSLSHKAYTCVYSSESSYLEGTPSTFKITTYTMGPDVIKRRPTRNKVQFVKNFFVLIYIFY